MIHEIQQTVERFNRHISERRSLRELFESADSVHIRTFDKRGASEMVEIDKNLLGFDGYYGGYASMGGRIDVIGLDKNNVLVGSMSLNRN